VKVVIAEDDPISRSLLERALAQWGYQPLSTGDGCQAWQFLQEEHGPRLAILDWGMPGMDGLEVCRRVRARPSPEPAYLILLTGRGAKEDVVAGLRAGANDYLTKPFDRDELRARLQVGSQVVTLQQSLAAQVRELEDALEQIRRTEEQLRQAQKMEAVGRLAGGVAHDFNNLLTIINGFSEVLIGELRTEDPKRGMLEEIKKAGIRAASLTRQLLAFSRKQILQPRVLDLNELVCEVQRMLGRLIGEDMQLSTSLAPALGRVKADPGQIEQILMNLAVNARDAMPTGGKLTVQTDEVEIHEGDGLASPEFSPGRYVRLAVSDTGCGMDPQTLARIYEPFFTTKEVGKGTGLGLATVYGIVKQSGGYVRATSEVGKGTRFEVYLPIVEEACVAQDTSQNRLPPQGGKETILLVEDEEGLRALARQVLQSKGYTVLEAGNGEEALRITEKNVATLDLLLTDVVMPHMGGRVLAEAVASRYPSVDVLYMSGYTDDAVLRHGVMQSENALIQKPFTMDALLYKVREALDKNKAVHCHAVA
jgi:two-component system, cell cycle sensor histidine kinase and response regulator CckA